MDDALTETTDASGHGRLLQALRRLGAWAETAPYPLDAGALATSVAQLRGDLLSLAGAGTLPTAPGEGSPEAASLIRASLAAEIAAFDRAVDELLRTPVAGEARSREATARIVRLAYRIEALLEVVALSGEDVLFAPPAASNGHAPTPHEEPPRPAAPAGIGRVRPLRDDEIEEFVRRHRWGVLSTTVDGQPYAVPVAYGYRDGRFYLVTAPGRKTRNLEANPAVCFTIVEVEGSGTRWRSVVATGTVRWVEGLRERLVALDALTRQHGRVPVRSWRDISRLAGARVACIMPSEITGRTREG
ncbi:MAG TPA: pyridoxamine 5'-phosphate oxidase family protein [Longimicrobiales bacterium]|jgi:nitroimidazol reductase NimA-like FMN-containing flavoprotein (pyridoxamine 5'-phosphate oxidase superfamily)